MPVLQPDPLRYFVSAVFQAAGVPVPTSEAVSDSLVEANLLGHDSHGVIRVVEYLAKMREGKLDPKAEPEIVKKSDNTILVDGHWAFGQMVARRTMELLIPMAREHNLACAGIHHCPNIGLVGTYPAMAAKRGMISIALVTSDASKPRVAPFGAKTPLLGTNPLAAAIPVKDMPPIIMDFSTSAVASGKIRVARDKGESLPSGWILDRDGQPTQNPKDYYAGGMMLPAAGHKGYALGLLVEIMGGILTGCGSLAVPSTGYRGGNGIFFLVLNVDAFQPLEGFADQVCELAQTIKRTPSAVPGEEVLLPGEPEHSTKHTRIQTGISLPEATWSSLVKEAQDLGLDCEQLLRNMPTCQ